MNDPRQVFGWSWRRRWLSIVVVIVIIISFIIHIIVVIRRVVCGGDGGVIVILGTGSTGLYELVYYGRRWLSQWWQTLRTMRLGNDPGVVIGDNV